MVDLPATLSDVTRRSGKGTSRQTIRIDEPLWNELGKAAERANTNRSDLIRDFVRWYLGSPDAPEPTRPEPEED